MSTTIILADDHPLLLNGTKEFLEKKWFKVIDTATDGNTAYNKISNDLSKYFISLETFMDEFSTIFFRQLEKK